MMDGQKQTEISVGLVDMQLALLVSLALKEVISKQLYGLNLSGYIKCNIMNAKKLNFQNIGNGMVWALN